MNIDDFPPAAVTRRATLNAVTGEDGETLTRILKVIQWQSGRGNYGVRIEVKANERILKILKDHGYEVRTHQSNAPLPAGYSSLMISWE